MNFKFKYTDKIVGAFIILSILLLLISSFLIIFNKKIFTKKFFYKTQFYDAIGLKLNQDIIYKGYKIGKIYNFNLNKQNTIDTIFYIYSDYIDKINENSVINKSNNPLTGTSIILESNLTNNRIADEYSFIPSMDMPESQLMVKNGEIEKKSDTFSTILEDVGSIVSSLTRDHNADENSIVRILVNTADIVESIKGEMVHINTILYNFKLLSNKMQTPDGLVQRLLDPDGTIMFNSLQKSLDNLASMMGELNEFSQFINGQSTQIETLLVESKMTMKQAQEVIEGIRNNPIIRAGISEKKEQDVIKQNIRDRDF
ncbi:MAG: MCE family protein [Spirochaetes bacterium]|nr:MCE family protein [Spirochaetota bacterium]